MKIGVFDSGIGGLTTLKEIKKLLPDEEFLYFGDSENNPYGEKSDEELEKITSKIVSDFVDQGVKMVVIACNTATTRCIRKLREKFPEIIFIGTEPAVKPACDDNNKNILILVTPSTATSNQLVKLIKNNQKSEQAITIVPCCGLANAIEVKNEKKIYEALDKNLGDYKKQNFDAVVLGCTHYIYIKDEIKKLFPNAKFYDGNMGVAKRVKSLLEG